MIQYHNIFTNLKFTGVLDSNWFRDTKAICRSKIKVLLYLPFSPLFLSLQLQYTVNVRNPNIPISDILESVPFPNSSDFEHSDLGRFY